MASPVSDIREERRGAVAWITFDRPAARNSFTKAMYADLRELCGRLAADDAVRVVVFQGRGDDAFVAGSDIASVGEIRTREDAQAYEAHVEATLGAVERLPKPTIALIRGVAAGGGAALALVCDIRVAAENARFGVPIARTVGNTLSLLNVARMVEVLGPATTKELLFTAELVDAPEAHRRGAVSAVLPLAEIERYVSDLAGSLAANAPLTLRTSKLAVLASLDARRAALGPGNEIVELAYLSEDFREGTTAFLEKRKPVWKGR
ncbi:MAG: enoyl-CoA hydratase [Chloroflexi bacterium]|nr:MAG: enoyl-CoA hydratase [Chloroflexota bacterium]